MPFHPTSLESLLLKGDLYTNSGHKFFPPQGNVYSFDEGSNNPNGVPDGTYAVEQIIEGCQRVEKWLTKISSHSAVGSA